MSLDTRTVMTRGLDIRLERCFVSLPLHSPDTPRVVSQCLTRSVPRHVIMTLQRATALNTRL